jgi:hypothetical protein
MARSGGPDPYQSLGEEAPDEKHARQGFALKI